MRHSSCTEGNVCSPWFLCAVPFWWVGETPPRSALHLLLLLQGRFLHGSSPPWLTPKRLQELLPRLCNEGCWELRVLTWKTQLALPWRICLRSCLSLSDFHITSSAIHAPCWRFSDIAALQQGFRNWLSYCMLSMYFSNELSCLFNITFLRSPQQLISSILKSNTERSCILSWAFPLRKLWSAYFGGSPNSNQHGKSKTCHPPWCRIQLKNNRQKEWFLKSLVPVTISL